jgi:Mg2+/Co2+ transporter CorC
MTTIAGVAFRLLDRLPREGDQVIHEGFSIKVLEMEGQRIARVRVSRGEDLEEATPAATPEVPGPEVPEAAGNESKDRPED